MDGSTIFLCIIIGLLAIKGFMGDALQSSSVYLPQFLPQYPASPRNPFNTTFAVIVGLVILISSLWLLAKTGGEFPETALSTKDSTFREIPREASQGKMRINQSPASRNHMLFATKVTTNTLPDKAEGEPSREVRDLGRSCYFVAVIKCGSLEAGAVIQRIFSQRNFQIVETGSNRYLTGIFVDSPEAGREIIRDLNRHPDDLKRYKMRPRLIDLGSTFGVPKLTPGDEYWSCVLSN